MGEIKKFGRSINHYERDRNWIKICYNGEENFYKIKRAIKKLKSLFKKDISQ